MADELSFIPTKAARLKKGTDTPFQAIVYEAHKRKAQSKKVDEKPDDCVPKPKELDMKRVRFEVFKFGMSGFDSKRKEECEVKLAIELGAKPPKNKGQNYKDLMKLKKQEAQEKLEETKLANAGKIKGLSNDKGKKWLYGKKQKDKKNKGILEPYGKPGDASFKKRKKFREK